MIAYSKVPKTSIASAVGPSLGLRSVGPRPGGDPAGEEVGASVYSFYTNKSSKYRNKQARSEEDRARRRWSARLAMGTQSSALSRVLGQEAARLGRDDLRDMSSLVALCGQVSVWKCAGCGEEFGKKILHCENRFCPYCLRRRSARLAAVYTQAVSLMRFPHFVTLSAVSSHSLADAHNLLWDSLTRLRTKKEFKKLYRGGIDFEEFTYSSEFGYHAHVHCFWDSTQRLYDWDTLMELWRKATRGKGKAVYIKLVPASVDRAQVIRYAIAYPCKLSMLAPAQLVEMLDFLPGARLVRAWGSVRGFAAGFADGVHDAKLAAPLASRDEYSPAKQLGYDVGYADQSALLAASEGFGVHLGADSACPSCGVSELLSNGQLSGRGSHWLQPANKRWPRWKVGSRPGMPGYYSLMPAESSGEGAGVGVAGRRQDDTGPPP